MTANDQPKKKIIRRKGNTLERWEVASVKAMLGKTEYNDQDILAYFTGPTRSVNHRLIGEIRTDAKHKTVKAASDDDLKAFLATWPDIDHETGVNGGAKVGHGGGAKPGQLVRMCAMARASHIAGTCHGALARQGQ